MIISRELWNSMFYGILSLSVILFYVFNSVPAQPQIKEAKEDQKLLRDGHNDSLYITSERKNCAKQSVVPWKRKLLDEYHREQQQLNGKRTLNENEQTLNPLEILAAAAASISESDAAGTTGFLMANGTDENLSSETEQSADRPELHTVLRSPQNDSKTISSNKGDGMIPTDVMISRLKQFGAHFDALALGSGPYLDENGTVWVRHMSIIERTGDNSKSALIYRMPLQKSKEWDELYRKRTSNEK